MNQRKMFNLSSRNFFLLKLNQIFKDDYLNNFCYLIINFIFKYLCISFPFLYICTQSCIIFIFDLHHCNNTSRQYCSTSYINILWSLYRDCIQISDESLGAISYVNYNHSIITIRLIAFKNLFENCLIYNIYTYK